MGMLILDRVSAVIMMWWKQDGGGRGVVWLGGMWVR